VLRNNLKGKHNMGEAIRHRLDEQAFVIEPVLGMQTVEAELSFANEKKFVNAMTQMIHTKRKTVDAGVGSQPSNRKKSTLEIGQDLTEIISSGVTPLADEMKMKPTLPAIILRIPDETAD